MIDEKKLIEDVKKFMEGKLSQLSLFTLSRRKVEQFIETKEDLISIIEQQPKADWIPCEERLPEGKETDKILVTDKDGIMAVCYFLEVTKVFKVRWNSEEFQGAFAWQPVPTLYKKEGAE